MIIIGCTKKLQSKAGFNIINETEPAVNPFYSWHAHLFTANRRNCVIVMNDYTRYSVVIYGLKKAEFTNFADIFREALKQNLQADSFNQSQIESYISKIDKVIFTKTKNRSILGSINDTLHIIDYVIHDYLSAKGIDIIGLNLFVNKLVLLPLEKIDLPPFPVDAMRELLSGE